MKCRSAIVHLTLFLGLFPSCSWKQVKIISVGFYSIKVVFGNNMHWNTEEKFLFWEQKTVLRNKNQFFMFCFVFVFAFPLSSASFLFKYSNMGSVAHQSLLHVSSILVPLLPWIQTHTLSLVSPFPMLLLSIFLIYVTGGCSEDLISTYTLCVTIFYQ